MKIEKYFKLEDANISSCLKFTIELGIKYLKKAYNPLFGDIRNAQKAFCHYLGCRERQQRESERAERIGLLFGIPYGFCCLCPT